MLSASTSTKIPLKSKISVDLSSPSPNDTPTWISQSMEMDSEENALKDAIGSAEERNETKNMEEEPESIDLGDLDIIGLEQVCKTKSYDKIPEGQLDNLEIILSRAQRQRSLGI